MLRKPSAWLPLLLSLGALVLVAGYALVAGTPAGPSHDEGAAARVFQLTMLGVAASVAYLAVRWLPVAPRAAAGILALQLAVAALPVITIALLER